MGQWNILRFSLCKIGSTARLRERLVGSQGDDIEYSTRRSGPRQLGGDDTSHLLIDALARLDNDSRLSQNTRDDEEIDTARDIAIRINIHICNFYLTLFSSAIINPIFQPLSLSPLSQP